MRTMLLVPLVGAFLLAGCSGSGGEKLSDEEARAVAQEALEAFAADFTAGDGPIRIIEGAFEVNDPALGSASVDVRLERGRNDDVHILVDMEGSGLTFAVEMYCSPDVEVMSWGDESYESRPDVDQPCQGALDTDEGLDVGGLGDSEIDSVEARSDGSVTATFTSDSGDFVIDVDDEGRLVSIEVDGEQGDGTFDVKYGAKRALEVPEADSRLPADIDFDIAPIEDGQVWTVTASPQQPIIDDFEMRFMLQGEPVAQKPLADGIQPNGDYVFEFDDADNDGHITVGDVITFRAPEGSSATPVLHDLWAGKDVGFNPIPGLGFAAIVAGLLLVGLAYRRFD